MVPYRNPVSSDIHCYRQFELWVKDANDSASIFTQYGVNLSIPIITSFDWTTNTDFDKDINFKVGNGVADSFFNFKNLNISSKNYTCKIVCKIGNDMGTAIDSKSVNVHIISMCAKVSVSTSSVDFHYQIRNQTQNVTFPPMLPTWSDSTYTADDLYNTCGDFIYYFGNDTNQAISVFDDIFLNITDRT